MRTTRCVALLASGVIALTMLPVPALAGGHGGAGGGGHRIQTGMHSQAASDVHFRQTLHDGSYADHAKFGSGAMENNGNAHGPGNGSGADRPMDGSANGAHTNR